MHRARLHVRAWRLVVTRGDFVTICTATGRDVPALVTMASPDGRSLILSFDAMIGGWLGTMPVFQHDDGTWRGLDGTWVGLTLQPPLSPADAEAFLITVAVRLGWARDPDV